MDAGFFNSQGMVWPRELKLEEGGDPTHFSGGASVAVSPKGFDIR